MTTTRKRAHASAKKAEKRGASVKAATYSTLAKAARDRHNQRFVLKLYVTGLTEASARAIAQVRALCEERLGGRYELQVFDIYQLPALAKDEQILATPTLIKVLPRPLRRFVGNLSSVDRVLFGLDLSEKP